MNRPVPSLPIVDAAAVAATASGPGACETPNGGGCGTSGCCGGGGGPAAASMTDMGGPVYWRSLDELRGEASFEEQFLHREFPVAASEFPEGVSRRRWMQLMGASIALVGAAGGCRYPEEKILPFVIRPEGRVPGEPYMRSTNFELAGRVYNLLIQNIDGRPIKVEPNDSHPGATGTDVFAQASILALYDPDRTRSEDEQVVLTKGELRRGRTTYDEFLGFGRVLINTLAKQDQGESFAVLMSSTRSPSMARMLKSLQQKLPKATFCRFDNVDGTSMAEATSATLGKPATQTLDLANADVIVSLQCDLLGNHRGMVTQSEGFAAGRDPDPNKNMNRLYVVEGGYTTTGAAADARLGIAPSQMPGLLAELARRVAAASGDEAEESEFDGVPFDQAAADERVERFLTAAARDLAAAGERGVVAVGDALGSQAIQAGMALNQSLGSLGKVQKFLPAVDADLGEMVALPELVSGIGDGKIKSLLILGNNPVYTSPSDIDLSAAIASVEHSMYVGEYDDETGAVCDYSAPQAHRLESWGDVIDDTGHYGVCQPQILPLLGGLSAMEVVAALLGESTDAEAIVRRTADSIGGNLADRQWRKLLHDGYLKDLTVEFLTDANVSAGDADEKFAVTSAVDRDNLEVIFAPADGVYDGRFANNGWLQELPQSLTAMCWDNAALMSPATAEALGLKHGLMVALRKGDAKIELPVYELPGCAPGVITIPIGYGRTRAGHVGGYTDYDVDVVGFDVAPLRNYAEMQTMSGVEGRPRYDSYELATTQNHWAIDELGRDEREQRSFDLVREGTKALMKKVPEFAEALGPHVPEVGPSGSPWHEPIDEIEEESPKTPQWGMTIDLNKCTGCNACVVACQSENNVPIVGREQVMQSREMHWLRIDRYFQGNPENADVVQQPVACMHCETAPCEQVCPVAATVHTNEGINAMAYNRCIGTRYCANNCPYKVRRFNYFNYNEAVGVGYGWDAFPENIEEAPRRMESLVLNPNVTVRGRGVMEKCTYCVQRVEAAKIDARVNNKGVVEDGAVQVACQTACPSHAIEFGNLQDSTSKVAKTRQDVRSYGMLTQLNVKPRTEYLARVRNTPPSLMSTLQLKYLAELEAPHHGGHGHDDHGGGDHGGGDHGHDDHHGHDHGKERHDAGDHPVEDHVDGNDPVADPTTADPVS